MYQSGRFKRSWRRTRTLVTVFDEPEDVIVFEGFKDMTEDNLKELYDSLGLAMTFKDFLYSAIT